MAPPRKCLLPTALATATLILSGVAWAGQTAAPPLDAVELAIARAERALEDGEPQLAESHYRSALLEAWLVLGALEVAAGDPAAARSALQKAMTAAVETRRAATSLALVHLQLGEAAEAVALLHDLAFRRPGDLTVRRILAQALVAAGRAEEGVQELEEAYRAAPQDPELAFTLATGRVRLGDVEEAERLFAEVAALRPLPETWVLIGRTWRDFGYHERARAALQQALRVDPQARRAHYYLGTIELLSEGRARIPEAVGHFRRELEVAPEDVESRLYLGMALAEDRRFAEALPALEAVVEADPSRVDAFYYLGRCRLGLDRPRDAAAAFARALELAADDPPDDRRLESIHYQLALALRRQGNETAAAEHFDAAKRYSAELTEGAREDLARYLRDESDTETGMSMSLPAVADSGLRRLSPSELDELRRGLETALARTYLNLGVLTVRSEWLPERTRFLRAIPLLEQAAAIDPGFPGLQKALGVVRFNAGQLAAATGPLAAALADDPGDADLRRTLALAWLDVGEYPRAAELLATDPRRTDDPGLQYAYGMALVRSERPAEAEAVFARLLDEHAEWPELHALLGQAYAQQGDFEAAVDSLRYALELDPVVAEAHATLGSIFLRQGRLAEAEKELRAELAGHPRDAESRYLLATVLSLDRQEEEAAALLHSLLAEEPGHADARYLLGKLLLAGGDAEAAAAQLESAARLSPGDANVRYQLGQAYQKLGRVELAREQFETFRELKTEERGEPQ